ncbi:MAG: hypothetical protein Q8P67_12370 [archaeon]|nr:hypothetical protein [archaeon]
MLLVTPTILRKKSATLDSESDSPSPRKRNGEEKRWGTDEKEETDKKPPRKRRGLKRRITRFLFLNLEQKKEERLIDRRRKNGEEKEERER